MEYHELICPNCEHKTISTSIYTTCAKCGTFFYASQSDPKKMPRWHFPVIRG